MGCLHGKELPKIQLSKQSSVERDPWWKDLKSADLSLAYMSELDERIRVLEVRNRIYEGKNKSQKAKNREQDEKNRHYERELRCIEHIGKDQIKNQEERNRQQEDRNRKQEVKNKHQEESNRNQQKLNMEQEYRNTLQEEKNRCQEEKYHQIMKQKVIDRENDRTDGNRRQICLKQEEKEKVIKHDMINRAEMAERILDTEVENIIRNVQKDFRKFMDSFETQTEKECSQGTLFII